MSERTFNQDEVYSIRDAVGKAFTALRKQGYVARVNFSCCTGCASYELSEMTCFRVLSQAEGLLHLNAGECVCEGFSGTVNGDLCKPQA